MSNKHMNEVTITASAAVGSGKSALLGEIEILCKALGVPCRYADEAAAQAEKNGTHADWTWALELYKPSVVLVETCLTEERRNKHIAKMKRCIEVFLEEWQTVEGKCNHSRAEQGHYCPACEAEEILS